ncbi:hypothetical protein Tco_0205207 [Tanacetum coccineum]
MLQTNNESTTANASFCNGSWFFLLSGCWFKVSFAIGDSVSCVGSDEKRRVWAFFRCMFPSLCPSQTMDGVLSVWIGVATTSLGRALTSECAVELEVEDTGLYISPPYFHGGVRIHFTCNKVHVRSEADGFERLRGTRILVTCISQQLEVEGDGNENVPLYYFITDNIRIQFGREEFCLVTGLRKNDKVTKNTSAIAISSNSSDESVGSPPSGLFFLDVFVASPTGLCGLIPYSDSDSDSPDEMSKVASRPSSSSEFPIAPVTALPGIRRRSAILIRPGEAIPFGRPYRTHLNGLHKFLTAKKRVRPLPARRLAWRHASPRSSDHHSSSSSSSSDSLPVHYLGLDAPNQAHSGSSTRDVSPRLGYPPRRAPRCSEAFRRWCAAPLSTLYPPTTSESSSGDSSERPLHSSSHSARPSSKRGRSQVDSVPSSTLVMGSLAPTRADLLPPRKRFRDSYSSEASIEEDTEIDPIETEVDMELGIGDGDDVRDHVEIDPRDVRDDTEEYEADTSAGDTVEVGIDPMSTPIVEEEIVEPAREDSFNSSCTRDGIVRSFEDMPIDLDDAVRNFYHHMSERVSIIKRIDSLRLENLKVRAMLDIERDRVNSLRLHMSLSQAEFRQVRRDRDDTRGRLRRTMTNTRSGMTPAAIEEMINQRVDAALEARRVNRDLELGNGNDNGGDGNGDGNGNGTGNGNNGGDNSGGNENRNVNGRGDRPAAHECIYQDFMKCQPLSFKGTEGVVGLIRWSKKMETVFHISNCPERYQVKELLKLMTKVYCSRNEIQKMETKL